MIEINLEDIKSINDLFYIGMSRKVPELFTEVNEAVNLNLGAGSGFKKINGTIPLDYPDWNAESDKIPYDDNSVDSITALHFLEHIKNVKFVIEEIDRVLKPGGFANIVVPYYNSNLQFSNLDHYSYFNEKTFQRLFTESTYVSTDYKFSLEVGTQFIIGIVERNLCLMTQLVKK